MLFVIWLISMMCHLSVLYCTFFGIRQLHLFSKSPTLLVQGLPWTQPVYPAESHSSWVPQLSSGTICGVSAWPSPFSIPSLSYDVELKLCKGNDEYGRSKKGITLSRDMKIDILDNTAQAIFEVKAYPDQDHWVSGFCSHQSTPLSLRTSQ